MLLAEKLDWKGLILVKKYLNLYTFRPKLGNMLCGTEH
jgi:hypothetical protein